MPETNRLNSCSVISNAPHEAYGQLLHVSSDISKPNGKANVAVFQKVARENAVRVLGLNQ